MFDYDLRPWGKFKVLDYGDNYKVKTLCVHPGECTSLQFHKHRSEIWVVVSGKGVVFKGDELYDLEHGVLSVIHKEEPHRIMNTGDTDLIIIETQLGVCDEDDIIRLDDKYGRT